MSRGRRRVRVGVAAAACGAAALVGLVALPVAPAAAADSCTEQRTGPVYVKELSAALNQMGVASVWPLATGRGVTVAVVDSGIDVGNAHLPADTAVRPGRTLLPAVEGWTPDQAGRNDLSGHGTAVASLLAGRAVDGSGQIGLARAATLVPVQVFGVASTEGLSDDRLKDLTPTTPRLAEGIPDDRR